MAEPKGSAPTEEKSDVASPSEETKSEIKTPTTPTRDSSSAVQSPQSPLPQRKPSTIERSNTADSSQEASSSRTSGSRRRSSSRKASIIYPSALPDSSRSLRKFSVPASNSRKVSRGWVGGEVPIALQPKASPNSSISSTSSIPEIPMKFQSIDLERELPEIFS
ncbi:unnamed protein product [Strongylus vulgaris]|uniref:Uncharacterized protein n=1 Tax=Strongylus vulgaris TaxID=40348 RepID=A0A3P7IF37_STRVU|nr:unnamed protein product [Strongylus vulgaris]